MRGFDDIFNMKVNKKGQVERIRTDDPYVLHGIMFWITWGFLSFVQLVSIRYMRSWWKVGMWIHRISGGLMWAFTFVFALMIYKENDWRFHTTLHAWTGFFTLCIITFPVAHGFYTRWVMVEHKWHTDWALLNILIHKLTSYGLQTLALVSNLVGGLAHERKTGKTLIKNLGIVFFAAAIVLVVLLEIYFQLKKRKETPYSDSDKILTHEEFERRIKKGEQLQILDDMVLDVSDYKWEHPGGAFLVEFHIGRDISKFFYGGFVLEN